MKMHYGRLSLLHASLFIGFFCEGIIVKLNFKQICIDLWFVHLYSTLQSKTKLISEFALVGIPISTLLEKTQAATTQRKNQHFTRRTNFKISFVFFKFFTFLKTFLKNIFCLETKYAVIAKIQFTGKKFFTMQMLQPLESDFCRN